MQHATDLAGLALANNYVWKVTNVEVSDSMRPTVLLAEAVFGLPQFQSTRKLLRYSAKA
jgi:hypothetical protein